MLSDDSNDAMLSDDDDACIVPAVEAALVAETDAALLVAERVTERAQWQRQRLRDYDVVTRSLETEIKRLRRSLEDAETENRRLERELFAEREKAAVLAVKADHISQERDRLQIGVTSVVGALGRSWDEPRPDVEALEEERTDDDRVAKAEVAALRLALQAERERSDLETAADQAEAIATEAFRCAQLAALRAESRALSCQRRRTVDVSSERDEAEEDLRPRLRDAEEAVRILASASPTVVDRCTATICAKLDVLTTRLHRAEASLRKVDLKSADAAEAKAAATDARLRELAGLYKRLLDKYQHAVASSSSPKYNHTPSPRAARSPARHSSSAFEGFGRLADDLSQTARSFRRTRALLDASTSHPSWPYSSPS